MFRVDDFVKPIPPKPVVEPKPAAPAQNQNATTATAKISETQNIGAANKAKLEKQYAANQPITPFNALEQIDKLPPPEPTDLAAVEKYKEQRKTIADNAVDNSQPPKFQDFLNYGLNGATASREHQEALTSYNSQISDLKKISADAVKYPDKILKPYEAQQEIENLPRPDRRDPQSVEDYNTRRAEIADSALLFATPPTRDDFKSAPGRMADFEYREALSGYNSTVAELEDFTNLRGTNILPPMTDAEVDKAANDYISAHDGVKNEDDAYGVGNDVAALAQTDPDGAILVMQKVQERLNNTDYGDNVASGFVDKSSDADLQKIAGASDGKTMLQDLQKRLLTGSSHPDEKDEAFKIQKNLGEVFSGSSQGIDRESETALTASYGDALNPDSSPEKAAAGLKSINRAAVGGDTAASDVQAFTTQLEAHQNDPQWLKTYYAALGSEKTAELMNNATNTSGYSNYLYSGTLNGNKDASDQFIKNTAIIRNSLDALQKSGNLSASDMDNLVNAMDKEGFQPNVAAEIFNKSNDQQLKEMFVSSAVQNGNDSLDAAGSMVLAGLPATDQARILNAMTGEQLDGFVKGALRGQEDVLDIGNYLKTGIGETTSIGGITEILAAANSGAGSPNPAFSTELQAELFDATGAALTDSKAFDNMADNTAFKDQLGKLAISQHDSFLQDALNADGGTTGEDLDKATQDKYSKIIEMTLFTPPLGDSAKGLMQHIDGYFKGVANDLALKDGMTDAQFVEKYGRNRAAMAGAYGEMTALFFKALDSGLTRVKDDADKAAEALEPIFGLASFAVGKGLDALGPVGAVISTTIDTLGVEDKVKESIKEKIKNGQIKEAFEDMKNNGVDISKLGDELYDQVHDNLLPNRTDPNGVYTEPSSRQDISIKDAWQNGYDHIEGAPKGE